MTLNVHMYQNLKWQCQKEKIVHLLLLLHKLLLLRGEGQGEDVDGGRGIPDQGHHREVLYKQGSV